MLLFVFMKLTRNTEMSVWLNWLQLKQCKEQASHLGAWV